VHSSFRVIIGLVIIDAATVCTVDCNCIPFVVAGAFCVLFWVSDRFAESIPLPVCICLSLGKNSSVNGKMFGHKIVCSPFLMSPFHSFVDNVFSNFVTTVFPSCLTHTHTLSLSLSMSPPPLVVFKKLLLRHLLRIVFCLFSYLTCPIFEGWSVFGI
jgi:hypothetical protein